MVNETQRKVLEELLEDPNFQGKKSLKYLLWLNTAVPKYKVGECRLCTDPGHRVYGHPVRNFKGKVVKISSWRDTCEFSYEFEGIVRTADGKETTTHYFLSESKVGDACDGNITVVGTSEDEYPDSTVLHI